MKELHKPKLSANMVMVTDAKGNPSASANITNTELNMLNNIRTNVQNQLDVFPKGRHLIPDYENGVSVTGFPFTAPSDGWFICYVRNIQAGNTSPGFPAMGVGWVYINSKLFIAGCAPSAYGSYQYLFGNAPIREGDVVKADYTSGNFVTIAFVFAKFFPFKTLN